MIKPGTHRWNAQQRVIHGQPAAAAIGEEVAAPLENSARDADPQRRRMIAAPTMLSAEEFSPTAGVTDTIAHKKQRLPAVLAWNEPVNGERQKIVSAKRAGALMRRGSRNGMFKSTNVTRRLAWH